MRFLQTRMDGFERERDGWGTGRGGVVGGQASEIRMYFVKTKKTR